MNEREIIRRISDTLPPTPPEVLVPIGDDCAVLRLGGRIWVAASDMLVSGKHFEDWATPEVAGYKAVAVNVSDVAAMGGTPRFILTSGGAPNPEATLRCMRGVRRLPARGRHDPRRRPYGGRGDTRGTRRAAGPALGCESGGSAGGDRRARRFGGGPAGPGERGLRPGTSRR